MKKAILVLALLMGILFSASPATTAASRPISSEIGSQKTEIIVTLSGVEGKTEPVIARHEAISSSEVEAPPRWKKRKIQRQNTVSKTNRRAKRIQRKNGIGDTSPRSVIPSTGAPRGADIEGPQTGILTINPTLA